MKKWTLSSALIKARGKETLLSPILFNMISMFLHFFIQRAQDDGLVTDLSSDLVDKGVSILQYVDDTILLFKNYLHQARNIKIILCLFEHM
jgi:hypothetical protein